MLSFLDLKKMEEEAGKHDTASSQAKERARRAAGLRKAEAEIIGLGGEFRYSWNNEAAAFLKPRMEATARELLRDFELQQEAIAKDHARKAQAIRDRIQAHIIQPTEDEAGRQE